MNDDKAKPAGIGPDVSRRSFMKTLGGGILVATAAPQTGILPTAQAAPRGDTVLGPDGVKLELEVNGQRHTLTIETRTTLAEALRDGLDLTGTKVVCDRGACGGCTVLLDGDPVCACMTLALDAAGRKVTTVEGLAKGGQLHPIQACFAEFDALQCGFCTSGLLMSCKALLDRNPAPKLEDVKQATAGNLCRCGTYPHVFQATLDAASRLKKG